MQLPQNLYSLGLKESCPKKWQLFFIFSTSLQDTFLEYFINL